MARGFESKDVEFQQAEAERLASKGPRLTAEPREVADRRRTLELSLSRMRIDLQTATAPAHRHTLVEAIAALEAELSALSGP